MHVHYLGRTYLREVLRGAQAYAAEHGHTIIPLNRLADSVLAAEPIRGLIAAVTQKEMFDTLHHHPFPVVNVSNFGYANHLPSVIHDDVEIGRMAARYLRRQGYRNFTYVAHPGALFSTEREQGFREILEPLKLPVSTEVPAGFVRRIPHGEFVASLREIASHLVAASDTAHAVFFHSDVFGRAFWRETATVLGSAQWSLGWMGVDALPFLDPHQNEFDLTSVRPDFFRQGWEAAKLLDLLMSGRTPPSSRTTIPPVEVVEKMTTPGPQGGNATVSRVCQWMDEALESGDPLRVEELAARARVSRRTLVRRFEQHLGRSVKEEIRRRRFARATILLLKPNATIAEVASHCGFASHSDFSRDFRQFAGTTPSEWRQANS